MAAASLLSRTAVSIGNASVSSGSSLLKSRFSSRPCLSTTFRLRQHAFPGLERGSGVAVRAADTPLPETKVDITEKDVKQNDEPLRVFDDTPAAKFFRPESERRPETGDKSVESVMKFDGVGPETVNSRLAMVGITWALVAEVLTGQSMVQQVTQGNGFIWFLLVAPVFIWATFVPIFTKGESPDSRQAGPFNAKAERWNGRAAMIGIVALLLTEQFFLKGALLGSFHH